MTSKSRNKANPGNAGPKKFGNAKFKGDPRTQGGFSQKITKGVYVGKGFECTKIGKGVYIGDLRRLRLIQPCLSLALAMAMVSDGLRSRASEWRSPVL